MASTRNKVVTLAQSYVGCKQGDKKHKDLVDTFNTVKPNGEVANYTCAWCSLFVTAIMIKAGNNADVCPRSYNCGTLVARAKELGIWVENDAYKANAGDIIVYDWQDTSAKGDNVGSPDHVGIIEKRADGYFTVIEGNKGTTKTCARRKIAVDGQYIRGFIVPKYAESNAEKLAKKAEYLAWPYGTDKKKWLYDSGTPTSKCKTAMKGRGYDSKIEYSDCGYCQNTIIYHALGYKTSVLKKDEAHTFADVKGMSVVFKGKSYKKASLNRGDILRYKKSNGHQHTLMYLGNGKIAEGGRGIRFLVIRKSQKYLAKNITYAEVLRAKEV